MNYSFEFVYILNNEKRFANGSNEDFKIIVSKKDKITTFSVIPKKAIEFLTFCIKRDYAFSDCDKVFANGFQSWTDTKEFTKKEKMDSLGAFGSSAIGKHFGLKYVGDYTFAPISKKAGVFHSHSYTYVSKGDEIELFGSLTDRVGYTIFSSDMNDNTLKVYKDLEGKLIDEKITVLSLYENLGEYETVFDDYFKSMNIKPITNKKIYGYTSWYNYYQNISDKAIIHDLRAIADEKNIDMFQIDDGYQTAVGDWLSIDLKKFPFGMKSVADEIHSKGLDAGLWLAPFGAQAGSYIAKAHPSWLLKDSLGMPMMVGANWGGFFALDIYNEEVRQYLKKVFDTVLNNWGYDLVKLDFIYAASIIPRNNKTRGEIAYDAIDLLRECVGDKKIIGCGAPMMPSFGKVEYMRIGADMSLRWSHTLMRKTMHREDVSTPNAIHNSIYRRHMNGRAFLCDSDVFLLRDNNIKFNFEERCRIAKFVKIFGSVIFTSDDISSYDENQLKAFRDTMADDDIKLISVKEKKNEVKILYSENEVTKMLSFNVDNGKPLEQRTTK